MGKVIIDTGALANGNYLIKKTGPKQFELQVAANAEVLELTANYAYVLQNGLWLDSILVKPTVNTTLRIGTSAGGQQLQPDIFLPAGIAEPITLNLYADGDRTLYIYGIIASTNLKVYIK